MDRCNLYTRRNVQGYYSHRSHKEDELNKSFKKELTIEKNVRIPGLVSSKEIKRKNMYDLRGNIVKSSKSKQLSTRSGKYRSPDLKTLESIIGNKSPKAQNDKIKGKIRKKL